MGDTVGKVVETLITIVIAVSASAAVWLVANLIVAQGRNHWTRFATLRLGIGGLLFGIILSGNRIISGSGSIEVATERNGDTSWVTTGSWSERLIASIWFPLFAMLAFAAVGALMSMRDSRSERTLIGAVGLAVVAGVGGALVREQFRPEVDAAALAIAVVVVAGLGAAIATLRRRDTISGALTGGAIGWVIGAWGAPELGAGSSVWSTIALAIPGAIIGVRAARPDVPDEAGRDRMDRRSRAFIFLGPALLFVTTNLVVPALRTLYLSLFDRNSEEFVGLDNYRTIFTNPKSWDTSTWRDMFTSQLMWVGLALLVLFVILGIRGKRRTGRVIELGSASSGPLLGAVVLIGFAVFTTVRGTIVNNLWWVLVVTLFSTSLGLAIAVLADGLKGERIAKSIIFMPMAVSLVGASVIWRFMYIARDSAKTQTGVFNSLWVALGRLSTGDGLPTLIIGAIVTIIFGLLLVNIARNLARGEPARAAAPAVFAILVGWFLIRYWRITGTGVGGHRIKDDGTIVAQPINFIQDPPFNNFWLMIVLVWIQTGFAMVILSAAIRAVPTELIEAAKVDGATDSQVFWRVTLPQIGTTIGVVVTAIIVLVMKVFDIVKVMTNGNFGTEVLANNMFREAFSFGDTGIGAALAMLIFISVVPIMFLNIRRMQRES
ncbi:MAG: sugar ABC transporter permease [Ilumatobacter sp.]